MKTSTLASHAWLTSVFVAVTLGCASSASIAPDDASRDVAAEVSADLPADLPADAPVDAPVDAGLSDVARDTPLDAASDARADTATTTDCAGAVAGGACAMEGVFCGGPCDPCRFCNILRCEGGRWGRLEAPPLPPDQCRDAGADASDAGDAGAVECDPRVVACNALPPPCAGGGEVREVRGGCWGECVPYARCRPIACDPDASGRCPVNTVCFRTTRLCGLPVM